MMCFFLLISDMHDISVINICEDNSWLFSMAKQIKYEIISFGAYDLTHNMDPVIVYSNSLLTIKNYVSGIYF